MRKIIYFVYLFSLLLVVVLVGMVNVFSQAMTGKRLLKWFQL